MVVSQWNTKANYEENPATTKKEAIHEDYGVDVSFPIHYSTFREPNNVHAQRYRKTMDGCYKAFGRHECDATERARIDMNRNQPRTQHNYTEIGFKKTRVPAHIWNDILKFWEENKDKEIAEDVSGLYLFSWFTFLYYMLIDDPFFTFYLHTVAPWQYVRKFLGQSFVHGQF